MSTESWIRVREELLTVGHNDPSAFCVWLEDYLIEIDKAREREEQEEMRELRQEIEDLKLALREIRTRVAIALHVDDAQAVYHDL